MTIFALINWCGAFFRVMLFILYIRGFDLPHFLGVLYAEYGHIRELLIVEVPTFE